jgi:HNH endonuclease
MKLKEGRRIVDITLVTQGQELEFQAYIRRRVAIDPKTGCWNWTLYKTADGYGRCSLRHPTTREKWMVIPHRLSYTVFVGPIPVEMTVDHKCCNPACCNPEHLQLLSTDVNTMLGTGVGPQNHVKTHCPQGHPYDQENTYYRKNPNGKPSRNCRMCSRERQRQYYASRPR